MVCNNENHVLFQQLDYRWVQTGSWQTDSAITALSWNLEGTRLLTGGDVLQLWHQQTPLVSDEDYDGSGKVSFYVKDLT